MTFSLDLVITEIKADFDPYGGEYTQICFGQRLPIPLPPEHAKAFPPQPKPVCYKHIFHIFIPREKWHGQYTMWQEFHAVFKDNGEVELKKKEV